MCAAALVVADSHTLPSTTPEVEAEATITEKKIA